MMWLWLYLAGIPVCSFLLGYFWRDDIYKHRTLMTLTVLSWPLFAAILAIVAVPAAFGDLYAAWRKA